MTYQSAEWAQTSPMRPQRRPRSASAGNGSSASHYTHSPLPSAPTTALWSTRNDEATSTMSPDSHDNRKPSSLSAGISIDPDTLLLSEKAKNFGCRAHQNPNVNSLVSLGNLPTWWLMLSETQQHRELYYLLGGNIIAKIRPWGALRTIVLSRTGRGLV
jgi:hypothetical protein